MAERVNKNVDWLVDDTGQVTGYQRFPGDKQALVSNAGIPKSAAQALSGSKKITVKDGRVLIGGQDYRGVFINAHDQFTDMLLGNTNYVADLPAIAASGVKLIRVNMGPLTSALWITQIGTSGTAPVSTFLTNLRLFLDTAQDAGLGVILCVFWSHDQVPLALASTQADYQTPGSTTRAYMKALASLVAQKFQAHPALAAWQVGNEWFDFASVAKFAKVGNTTDTSIDHFAALLGTVNDVVDGIRLWDNDRAIISPTGGGARYESVSPALWIRKMMGSVGKCDLVGFHMYPDTDRSGFSHFGTGRANNMGTCELTLPMLRNAALQLGKAVIVDEVGGDDDYTTYGSPAIGTLSRLSWSKCHAAGIELVGDWGWYADTSLYATSAPNLKLYRNPLMALIAPYNATLKAGFVAPSLPYVNPPGSMPLPSLCARGSGLTNSWVKIPNNADLFHDQVSTARLVIMFWGRKRAAMGTANFYISCNDAASQGYRMAGNANEGLTWQQSFGGALTSFVSGTLNFPADCPADATFAFWNEWHHYAIVWDGATLPAPQDDGNQHLTVYVDGIATLRSGQSGKVANGMSNRDVYLLAGSDGLSGFTKADIFDLMIGKNFVLTDLQLANYLRTGAVPAGIQHRWKLNGDTKDSIGTLDAVAGAALTFVSNGLGNQ